MVEHAGITNFTDEEYQRFTALALPLIRDDRVAPLARFENLVGLPRFSALRFLRRLRDDGLITGGHLAGKAKLTSLGHRAVQHIVTVRDGMALSRVKIKIPEELK